MPPTAFSSRILASVKPRVVSGMRPTGKLHLGHLVGALQQLGRAAGAVRLLLLRRRLARADQRLRRHQSASSPTRYDMVADWIAAGLDPERSTLLRAVAGAGARRAVPAAVDDGADAVARARADLQGADGAADGEGSVDARLPRLSAAADRRRHHLRRALRAGRRGSGAAPGAEPRDRAPLPQLLRRALRRAAAAADAVPAAARARQPEDEQELRQHDRSRRTTRRRCGRK